MLVHLRKKNQVTCFIFLKPLKYRAKFIADDIYFHFFNFSKTTDLEISCESSAWQKTFIFFIFF